jgi:hypothetical protein
MFIMFFLTQSDEEEPEDGDAGVGSKAQLPEKGASNNNPKVYDVVVKLILLFLQRVQYEQGSQFSVHGDVKGGEAKVGSESGAAAKGGEAKKHKNNP